MGINHMAAVGQQPEQMHKQVDCVPDSALRNKLNTLSTCIEMPNPTHDIADSKNPAGKHQSYLTSPRRTSEPQSHTNQPVSETKCATVVEH